MPNVRALGSGLLVAVLGRDRVRPGHAAVLSWAFVLAGLGCAVVVWHGLGGVALDDPTTLVRLALVVGVAGPLMLLPRWPLVAWRIAVVGTLLNLPGQVAPDGLSWPWHPVQPVILGGLVLVVALVHRSATVFWIAMLSVATTIAHLPAERARVLVAAIIVVAVAGDQVRRRFEVYRRRAVRLDAQLVAERERAEVAQERHAVLAERQRIAREMHDVVAHHMSMIAVRAETAPYRLGDEPDDRDAEFVAIAGASRSALQDMRRLLSVLRSDSADTASPPSPGMADILAMTEAARASGLDVALDQDSGTVPPLVGRTAYRIVQEGLSNATRHAPGAAIRVRLSVDERALHIVVRNAPGESLTNERSRTADGLGKAAAGPSRSESGGHGIVGMRERVRALGGTISAGRCDDGGFEVRAELPLA
ncbi:two-component sensor histidine kinase [Actinoplanes bogorensis]|uniref:histidine kinase n=1 Tax=Paractinoplanes bogorensis TaxID=1610840 RepID=A0ABS5YKA0_9ACTN|nr:histidine kinase [Actinoplanes bogorensis]MBU2663896.1 two-component sensor histidine kinase [Actinoplanes bogorensis]